MSPSSVAPVERIVGRDSSAGKALALLDALAGQPSVLGVSELASRTDLPKSTAHRLLTVLIDGGYVQRVGDQYTLSIRAFELGNRVRVARPNGLRDRAIPFMAELYAQTRETVHLAVLRGTDIVYVEKLFGHDSVRPGTVIGSRRPAYATGLGKAMMAFGQPEDVRRCLNVPFRRFTSFTIASPEGMRRTLRRVRDEGCATDYEESFLGIYCIAAPVIDLRTGQAIAALSLTTGVGHSEVMKYKKALLRAAEQLAKQLSPIAA